MTLDEARLMANVNARAGRLFEDGYRARWVGPGLLAVRNGRGTTYGVDTAAGACGCRFYRAHDGRLPCKHLLGWEGLLARQRACRRLLAILLLRAWADLDDGSTFLGDAAPGGPARGGTDDAG